MDPASRSQALIHLEPLILPYHPPKIEQKPKIPVDGTCNYTREEWESKKPSITDLYATGTLDFVMVCLKGIGFPVSRRQLKRKVGDWGLRKNLKREERIKLVTQQEHAKACGEDFTFSLSSKNITTAQLERTAKRYKIFVDAPVEGIAVDAKIQNDMVDDQTDGRSAPGPPPLILETIEQIATSHPTDSNEIHIEHNELVCAASSGSAVTNLGSNTPSDDVQLLSRSDESYSFSRADADEVSQERIRLQTKKELALQLSKIFIQIYGAASFEDETVKALKAPKKRKRTQLLTFDGCSASQAAQGIGNKSEQFQMRVRLGQCWRMYELGFTPVQHPSDTVSIMLPPDFEGGYLSEQEAQKKAEVLFLDQHYGLNDSRTLISLLDLSVTLHLQCRGVITEKLQHRTACMMRKALGEDCKATLECLSWLANTLYENGQYGRSLDLLDYVERAASHVQYHGRRFQARNLWKKAWVLFSLNKIEEAERLFQKLEDSFQTTSPWEFPLLISIYFNYSVALETANKIHEAKERYLQVLSWARGLKEGKMVMFMLACQRRLARMMISNGEVDDGEKMLEAVNRELEVLRPGIDFKKPIIFAL